MAQWQKNFTPADNVNSGQEFGVNDYPTTAGFNVPINNSQYLHDNCVGTYAQNFSSTQKAQARANIGAGTSSFSGSYNDLSNKPALKTVATSGSYSDLSSKPKFYQVTVLLNYSYTSSFSGKLMITFNSTSSSVSSVADLLSKLSTNIACSGYFKSLNDYYAIVYAEQISNGIKVRLSNSAYNDMSTSNLSIESQSYTTIQL